MTILTNEQQALLRTVCRRGMPTHGACLAGEIRVYFNGHTAVTQGFIGNHGMQFAVSPCGMSSIGFSLLLARLFAMLAFCSFADVFQLFQADQAMRVSGHDAFGDHMIGVLLQPSLPSTNHDQSPGRRTGAFLLKTLVIVPLMQKISAPITGNLPTGGFGWASAIIVLFIMVLPTTLSISIDALRAVPGSVREASLALGSTRWQMMSRAVIPSASARLGTAVVLGFTRAIGETLAVALVLGGSQIPNKIFTLQAFFQPNVNITAPIAQDFGETSGAAQNAYWTLAFVLLVITFIFVSISRLLASRSVYK